MSDQDQADADDFTERMKLEYADDPVTLAEILAIESGESDGDNVAVDDEGERPAESELNSDSGTVS